MADIIQLDAVRFPLRKRLHDLRRTLEVSEHRICASCDFFRRDANGEAAFCPAPASNECTNFLDGLRYKIADIENDITDGHDALNAIAV
jgi:hypothetical protein